MAILLLGACGGSAGTPPLEQASQPQYLETTAVLEQLNSSALPDGVDAAVYDELRSALQAALAAGPDRIMLDAPPPLAARVQDLQLRPFGDDRELSWSLVLPGDYDQNGEVGISDLAPLGRFYGSKAEQDFPSALAGGPLGSPFPYDLAESVVDGDGNGQIGLPDVSVIAQNFGRSLDSYLIFGSSDPFDYPAYAKNREIAAQGIVNLAQATGIPSRERRHFSLRLTDYDDAFSYWVRPALKGSPGAVSNAVGLSLPAHTGTLQMLSVSPLAAKPGEQLRLSFNQDLPADSSIISLRFGGPLQIPATDCFVSGNELRTVMPPLSAGTIELEVWQTGFSIGKASLTVKEAQTTLSQLHYDLSLDDSRDAMLAALENYLDDNQENAAAELTTYKGYLIQLSKLCQQRSQFADEAQQRRFLCYLENSGLMELLDMLATPDRGVSRAEESHFERMKLDAWSASLRTAQRSLSRPALAAAVLEDGSTMSPMLPLQIYLESLASCIDCFMPTDLNSLRMNSSVHGLRSGETGNGFRVEGLFSSQSAVTEGAYDRLQDRSLAMLPIGVDYPGDAAAELRAQLSVSTLNYYAGKPFMETSLHTVSLAGDPWEGHVGNYVETLDMQLYRLDSAWQLEDTVLSGLFRDWQELQPFGGNLSASIVSVRGDAGLVDASQTYDKLILHEPGRQTMDLRAWRIDSGGTALFWQPQAIVPVTLTTPLWVDRYGD